MNDLRYGYDENEAFFVDPKGQEMLTDEVVDTLNALLAVKDAAQTWNAHEDRIKKAGAKMDLLKALAALPEHLR